MSKTVIRNHAEPKWTQIIENRLQIMLGSMLAHINHIDIELDRTAETPGQPTIYSCSLTLTESGGERYQLYNDQADAKIAIEGALARARRTITRLGRTRGPGWRQVSEQ